MKITEMLKNTTQELRNLNVLDSEFVNKKQKIEKDFITIKSRVSELPEEIIGDFLCILSDLELELKNKG